MQQLDTEDTASRELPSADRSSSPANEALRQSSASHESTVEDEDQPYEEAAPEELLPPPDFKPFFALIEDPVSGEYHHPTVHYLFSDDDPEIFTDATLEAVSRTSALQAEGEAEVDERVLVLDIAANGKSVTTATSLSPRWQALKTVVSQAPSWGDTSTTTDRGLMVKIVGQEAPDSQHSKDDAQGAVGSMEHLVRTFGERLERLDEVIGKSAEVGASQEVPAQEGSNLE